MNGAEALLKTVAAAGIDVCFANGGTTEMPMILAFDSITAIKPMLGLFEGVCSGAADGYGRMKEKPALCLLHLGPGLANGVANLHNAKRARTPLLNVIGEHASWHLEANAPLAMDIDCLCKTFSGWQRTVRSVETIAQGHGRRDRGGLARADRKPHRPLRSPVERVPGRHSRGKKPGLRAP